MKLQAVSVKVVHEQDDKHFVEIKVRYREFLRDSFRKFQVGFTRKLLCKWITVIIFTAIPLFIIYKYLTECGTQEIAYSNYLRDQSGKVTLYDFLSYAKISYVSFVELITSVPSTIDQNLFAGSFSLSFFSLTIYLLVKRWMRERSVIPFLITVLLMISFSVGGFFSTLSYLFWPFMDMFRHEGLIGSFIKLFLKSRDLP